MFLVIFTSLLGERRGRGRARRRHPTGHATTWRRWRRSRVITAMLHEHRDQRDASPRDHGILKRTRGTPLPGWVYLSARVVHAIGRRARAGGDHRGVRRVVLRRERPDRQVARRSSSITVMVGAPWRSRRSGSRRRRSIPNADAAPAIVNAIILPLLFLSGIFIPLGDDAPEWMKVVGDIFPVRHFVDAMLGSFYGPPFPFEWSDVARRRGMGRGRAGRGDEVLHLGAAQAEAARQRLCVGNGACARLRGRRGRGAHQRIREVPPCGSVRLPRRAACCSPPAPRTTRRRRDRWPRDRRDGRRRPRDHRDPPPPPTAPAANADAFEAAGTLTVATGNPAFPPWWEGGESHGLRVRVQRPRQW